jgi:hypothetical protein
MLMATPTELNLTRNRGDTYPHLITVKDSAGVAVNIAGFAFKLTVDPSPDPADALENLFQITGVIEDAPNGQVSFTPTGVEADQDPDTYFYDIEMTDAGSAIRTIAKGSYTISQDITK